MKAHLPLILLLLVSLHGIVTALFSNLEPKIFLLPLLCPIFCTALMMIIVSTEVPPFSEASVNSWVLVVGAVWTAYVWTITPERSTELLEHPWAVVIWPSLLVTLGGLAASSLGPRLFQVTGLGSLQNAE